MSGSGSNGGFLDRWARRKAQARQGAMLEPAPVVPPVPVAAAAGLATPAPVAPLVAPAPAAPGASVPAEEVVPPPTLDDVARLSRDAADYSRFVAPRVPVDVQRAALKKLFTDPHFNIMDGLDTYIDDYGLPDPIPASVLRQMTQGKFLGLFDDEEAGRPPASATAAPDAAPLQVPETTEVSDRPDADPPDPDHPRDPPHSVTALAPAPATALDEDPDLRLQPQPAAGPKGAEAGFGAPADRAA